MRHSFRQYRPASPRAATYPELEAIAKAYSEKTGLTLDEAREQLSAASVAIFDSYITGGPGYVGQVVIVVFDGAPEFVHCYIEDTNESFAYKFAPIEQ